MIKPKKEKHKLVVIGDSLSQGFKNGGIYRTDLSFPAFIARSFNPDPGFEQPLFTAQGGIPLNLEVLLRGLVDEYGSDIEWRKYLNVASSTFRTLRRIKKYWQGGMKDLAVERETPFHNQSVWGFSLNDSWMVTAQNSREYINTHKERFSVFGILPENAKYITARLVLNPSFRKDFESFTQFDNAAFLSENGGIENLIVCLGHNNALGAVANLKVIWSEPEDLAVFSADRKCTIYRPEHFEQEYRIMAEKIASLKAGRVFVPTLPYPTIPPVCRGVNSDISGKKMGYFDYYTRFWIWDEDFNPDKHPHLTKEEALTIDETVDEYNAIIRKIAREYGWVVVPVAKYVAAMAHRRLGGQLLRSYPREFAAALKRNPATEYLVDDAGKVKLTTDYLRTDRETGKIYKGGIFSLDGLHPTTSAYGLMANIYMESMKKAGVKFQHKLDWDYIIAQDSLLTNPPVLLKELREVLRYLGMGNQERFFHLGKDVLTQTLEMFSDRKKIK